MNLRVLLVDDDEMVLFLHKTLVRNYDFSAHPLTFINGVEVLEYLNKNTGEGEKTLILLDINMPVMNGWELLDAIEQQSFSCEVYVVMVTSSMDMTDREKAGTYKQVIDYLEKPITPESLTRIKGLRQLKDLFK